MSRPLALTVAFALLAHGGCSPSRSESSKKEPAKNVPTRAAKAPPTAHAATVSDASGNRLALLTQRRDDDACTFATSSDYQIGRAKDGALTLTNPAGASRGSISAAAQGSLLRDAAGKTVGRVVHPPRLQAVSLIDAQGIAVFRIRIDKHGRAVIRDKASMPIMVVHPRGGRFVAETKTGAVRAYVTGEDDLMVAALLTTEFVEPELRGLLACDWALGRTKKYVP